MEGNCDSVVSRSVFQSEEAVLAPVDVSLSKL